LKGKHNPIFPPPHTTYDFLLDSFFLLVSSWRRCLPKRPYHFKMLISYLLKMMSSNIHVLFLVYINCVKQ
jgi:hypothetical protein